MEYSTNLAWHSYDIVYSQWTAENKIDVKAWSLHYPKCNLTAEFGWRFGCVMLVAANVAWILMQR